MGSEWKKVRLGDVATVRSGFAFKSKDMSSSGYPIIKIKNIIPPGVDIEDVQRVDPAVVEGNDRVYRFKLTTGDILIAMTGATVGKVGRMPKIEEPYYLNQRVGKVFLNKPDKADYDFLYYVLSQESYVKKMFGVADGSAQANISGKQIEELEIPLPPLPEQRAIAHILGTLDDKIELNRRMNETLEAMAQALFKSWFVDFDPVVVNAIKADNPIPDKFAKRAAHYRENPDALGLPEHILRLFPNRFQDSELGPIPDGWSVRRVGDEFNIIMGQSPPGSTYNENGNGLPFFQGRRDFGFRYPINRVYCTSPKRIANSSDTLISVRAPVGDINMAYEKCCIGRGVAAIRHKSRSRSYTYYSMRALSERFKSYEAEGTVFGAITKKQFQDIKNVTPPFDVIFSFEELVFPIDEYILSSEEEIQILSRNRDTILPKLISGELRVPDVEKILEEV